MKHIIISILCALIFSACGSKIKRDDEQTKYSIFNENLITANKYLVKEDAERIENYIKRRGWQMQDGDGGIRYIVCEHGDGDSISINPRLSMTYRIELLDGTECYNSDIDGVKEVTVGSSEMDAGLCRTFRSFCHGDSAILILPPHYAKGLIGDLNKIPPHSVIVYFIKIK